MLLEDFEEEDVMDFVESKGNLLDAFKQQYQELQKVYNKKNYKLY